MAALTSPALAYAYLSAAFDVGHGNKNPLHTLKPLILTVFENNTGKALNRDDVAADFAKMFGIDVPLNVLSYVMASMVNQDQTLLRKEAQGRKDIAHANYIPGDLKNAQESRKVAKKAKSIWSDVTGYISDQLIRSEKDFGTPEDVLEQFLDASSIGFIGSGGKAYAPTNDDKALNRFIFECIDSDNTGSFLEGLTELAVGDVVYQSIKSVTEYGASFEEAINRSMSGVKVFFDTRFIFNLLGVNGEEYERSAKETITLCNNTSSKLCVFQHTLDEIDVIVTTVAGRISNNQTARDGVASFALRRGMLPSDLLEFASGIPEQLEKLGFGVEVSSDIEAELSVDEKDLHTRLQVDLRQKNVDARTRDISSLTSVFRLRKGKPHRYLEDCKAIFITTNKGLSDSATSFFSNHFKDEGQRNSVQICMTDVVFSTRLWIKLPTNVRKLPKDQVLTHVLTNLRPNDALRSNFIGRLEEMNSQGRFSDVKLSVVALSGLTDRMLAIDYGLTQRDIKEEAALNTATKIIAQTREILKESSKRSRPEDLERIKKLEKELAEASSGASHGQLDVITTEFSDAKNEMELNSARQEGRDQVIDKLSTWVAYGVTVIILWPIVGFFVGFASETNNFLSILNLALALLTAFGLSFTGLIKKLASFIVDRLT